MKKEFIINGKSVNKNEFDKLFSNLIFSKELEEAFIEDNQNQNGVVRFTKAKNKEGKKYEYSTLSFPEKDIFEIKEIIENEI